MIAADMSRAFFNIGRLYAAVTSSNTILSQPNQPGLVEDSIGCFGTVLKVMFGLNNHSLYLEDYLAEIKVTLTQ